MRLEIDTQRCTGHGRCYGVAPELVTDDDRGYGQLIVDGEVDDGHLAAAERAVQACPERAITIRSDA